MTSRGFATLNGWNTVEIKVDIKTRMVDMELNGRKKTARNTWVSMFEDYDPILLGYKKNLRFVMKHYFDRNFVSVFQTFDLAFIVRFLKLSFQSMNCFDL